MAEEYHFDYHAVRLNRFAHASHSGKVKNKLIWKCSFFTGPIWKDGHTFSALCPELDVASQGKTSEEARDMLLEATMLHIEGAFEDGLPYLRPIPAAEDPRNIFPMEKIETFHFPISLSARP